MLTPLFIDSDRIIHLDADTLTLNDLNKMYNFDFKDNYVLGVYDFFGEGVDYFGIKSNIYINSGITLFNLKKLRKDNKAFEFLNLTNIYKEKILDQNIICFIQKLEGYQVNMQCLISEIILI